MRKSTYFKADLSLLKDKKNMVALEEVWNRHDEDITHLRRRFAFAYSRIHSSFKAIQKLKKPAKSFKTMLQEELQALMLELENVE